MRTLLTIPLPFQDFTELGVLQKLFPNSVILLCTFHVLKYIKGMIATALVPQERKSSINTAFRALVFAKDEADFNTKLITWTKEVEGVEVRTSTKQEANYVPLTTYYEKNWGSVREMWARFERKTLPIGAEHTTNRLERSFGVLKAWLKINNIGDITITRAVIQVVTWAETKMVQGFTVAQRKDMQIFDREPEIMKEYEKAALELNQVGCISFKKSVELMRKFEKKMMIVENGVKETFPTKYEEIDEDNNNDCEEEVEEKVYGATEDRCNCTKWRQDCLPCRHILFFRKEKKLPLFDKSVFEVYYHKERQEDLNCNQEGENDDSDERHDEVLSDDQEDQASKVMTVEEKFKVTNELTTELRDLLCHHGTPQLQEYLYELFKAIKNVRLGKPMFVGMRRRKQTSAENESSTVEAQTEEQNESDAEEGERFVFLKNIKKKGRPKTAKSKKLLHFHVPKSQSKKIKEADGLLSDTNMGSDLGQAGPVNVVEDSVLCVFPPGDGEIPFSTQDYVDLTPGEWINDQVVDFKLKYTQHQQSVESRSRVLLFGSNFYYSLKTPAALKGNYAQPKKWTKTAGLWRAGPTTVVLPICRAGHFITLVARLGDRPLMVTLNSLSGGPTKSAEAELLANFLLAERGWGATSFTYVSPKVPEQPNWTDCGLFTIKYVEMVLEDPERFLQMVLKPGPRELLDWFPYSDVKIMRGELAGLVRRLAQEQRNVGGPLYGRELVIPEIDFDQVTKYFLLLNMLLSCVRSLFCNNFSWE